MKTRYLSVLVVLTLIVGSFCGCSMGNAEANAKTLADVSQGGNNQNSKTQIAYEQYYGKLIEEYVLYGLNDDSVNDFPRGIMTCDLIDFDHDGLKELFYVVCRNDYDYTVCVYGVDQKSKNLKRMFEENPGPDGTFMPLKGEKNNYLLVSNFVDEGIQRYQILEYKNNNFENIKTYTKKLEEVLNQEGAPIDWVPTYYTEDSSVGMSEEEFLKDTFQYGITSQDELNSLFNQYCGRDKHSQKSMVKVTSELLGKQIQFDEYGVNQIANELKQNFNEGSWLNAIAVTDLNFDGCPEVIGGEIAPAGALGVSAYQFKDNQLQKLELKIVDTAYFRNLSEFTDSIMKLYVSKEDGSEHIFSVVSNQNTISGISEYSKEGSAIYKTAIAEIRLVDGENGTKVTAYNINGKDVGEEKFYQYTEEWKTKYTATEKLHSDYAFLSPENAFNFKKFMLNYALGLITLPEDLNEELRANEASLKVEILEDKKAVFKLTIPGLQESYLGDLPGSVLASGEYTFAVEFGKYNISLMKWAFSPGKTKQVALTEMQSSLCHKKGDLQGYEYIQQNVPVQKVEESIVWEVDMSNMEGFNFKNINEYRVEIGYPKVECSTLQDEQVVLEFGKREVGAN